MESFLEFLCTHVKVLTLNTMTAVELTFLSCRRGMTGEFSLDLHGLSLAGGERLCDENCVIKLNLLMSGSLSIRLEKKRDEFAKRLAYD